MSNASHHSSSAPSVSINHALTNSRPQPSQAERTADAKKAFLGLLGSASRDLDADLQLRGKTIHENANALAKQEKGLQDANKKLAKDNAEAEKWIEKSKEKLAEFDDLEDLGAGLEDDLQDLEAFLEMMETKQKNGTAGTQSR